jgi:integrase/recombinase XerD
MSEVAGAPMRDLRGYLTPQEVRKLIDHARTFRDLVILRLLWATGCRVSELLMITVEDISWRDEAIAVWTLKRKKHRRYQRLVSVDKRTLSIIKEYCDKNGIKKGPLLMLTSRRVEQIVAEAGRAAGITHVGRKKIHPHHLRHSHCVAFIRENPTMEGLRKLQQRVGHASITTTAHYLQYAAEEARPEVESVFGKW